MKSFIQYSPVGSVEITGYSAAMQNLLKAVAEVALWRRKYGYVQGERVLPPGLEDRMGTMQVELLKFGKAEAAQGGGQVKMGVVFAYEVELKNTRSELDQQGIRLKQQEAELTHLKKMIEQQRQQHQARVRALIKVAMDKGVDLRGSLGTVLEDREEPDDKDLTDKVRSLVKRFVREEMLK